MKIIEEDTVGFEPLIMRFTSNAPVPVAVASDAVAYICRWFDRTSDANPLEWEVAKEWSATVDQNGEVTAQCELMPANALAQLANDVGAVFPVFTELRLGMQGHAACSSVSLDWITVPSGDVFVCENRRTVEAFEITFTPITLGQFQEFLDDASYSPVPDQIENQPGYLIDHFTLNFGPNPKQVLFGVTNDDAVAYCEWAGNRLPTDAELARFFDWAVRDGRNFEWHGECWTSTTAANDKFVARNGPYVVQALDWPESRYRKLLPRHQYEFLEAPCFRVVKAS